MTMRRQLLGLGILAASSLLALQAANAMSGPTAIQIDGGPLGPLQISGGADGYLYYVNPVAGGEDTGADVANALIELQKTDGELQFTIEVGSNGGAIGLGTGSRPGQTSITTFDTGPLYAGYITVAPSGTPFTISAGQIGSLEGYESGIDWNNPSQIVTDIFEVQNSQSRGVSGNFTQGPISATVTFGDGFDTGVWNFIQGLLTYTINATNSASLYVAGDLGRTGNAARIYGGGSVGSYGTYYVNSDMIGSHQTWNAGAALFGNYSLSSTSPYSIGGWVEYFDSHTSPFDQANWFAGPNSEGVGVAVSPTWQYKDLFARVNAGYLYLLRNTTAGFKYGYGTSGTGRNTVDATLEGGLLF
jgi:hypothetical protein